MGSKRLKRKTDDRKKRLEKEDGGKLKKAQNMKSGGKLKKEYEKMAED